MREMKKLLISGIIFLLFSLDVKAEIKPLLPEEESKATIYFETYPSVIDLLKEEIYETKHWDENCSDNTIQITQEDAVRLMKIAVSESGNQGTVGQLMVMETIWNRVNSDLFPNTIQGVIEQPHQFSSVDDGRYQSAEPSWESHIALAEFEKNLSHDENLIGFETVDNGESLLSYFDFYETYKDHNFYTLKKD